MKMASNQTEHYGLNQWEAGDLFLRQEFNGDNDKVDQGLQALRVQVEGLSRAAVTVGYHMYNLTLQNYYDGKQTGHKKSMAFDGFQTKEEIAELRGGLIWNAGKLSLDSAGEGARAMGYGSSVTGMDGDTDTYTAQGGGQWTGCRVKLKNSMQVVTTLRVRYTATVNGKTAGNGYVDLGSISPGDTGREWDVAFAQPVPLVKGDQYSLNLKTDNSYIVPYCSASTSRFVGGTLLITPQTGSVGTLVSTPHTLPGWRRALAWVRHSGGETALALTAGGKGCPMERTEVRDTVNLQGAGCRESAFVLEQPMDAGAYRVQLELTRGEAVRTEVFDYGVIVM